MSYGDIIASIEALSKLGGWSSVQPPPDFGEIANRGYREFVRYTGGNNESLIIPTVVNQVSYPTLQNDPDLPNYDPRVWCNFWNTTLYNIIPGTPGSSWPLPQQTRNRMSQIDPFFLDVAVGQPLFWYHDHGQTNSIALYPPPATTGVNMLFWGVRELPPLVDPDDLTPFSEIYDEAIALFGAYYWGKRYTRGADRQVCLGYKVEAEALGNQFKKEIVGSESCLINRSVSLPATRYIQSGTRLWPTPQTPAWTGSLSNS